MAKMPEHSRTADVARRTIVGLFMVGLLLLVPSDARASLLSEEAEDKLATFIALFVIFVVPVVLIAVFWMVHILPEQIAHKRNHPQFEAIRTLCLLSLVFGGLLWPIAWVWAYSKPALHKLAYGTDKLHEERESTNRARKKQRRAFATGWPGSRGGFQHPSSEPFAPISRRSKPSSWITRPGRWKSSSLASMRSSSG